MQTKLLEKLAASASWIMAIGRTSFLVVVFLLLVMRSCFTIIRIDGASMDPTLRSGQWVGVDLVTHYFSPWKDGDIAIVRFPGDPIHTLYVKRIIGVPGDKLQLQDGHVVRNGVALTENYLALGTSTFEGPATLPAVVPQNSYIVLGDNRAISNDSRFFGLVASSDLYGKVIAY